MADAAGNAAIIRTLTKSEWREYKTLRLRALKDAPEAFSSTWETSSAYPDEEWQARLGRVSPETDLPLVAEIDGSLCGLLWGRIEEGGDLAQLYQMWVAPECRGYGIARRMMDNAMAWATSKGVTRIMLEVTEGDRPARRLYESCGFVPLDDLEPLREDSDLFVRAMEFRVSA